MALGQTGVCGIYIVVLDPTQEILFRIAFYKQLLGGVRFGSSSLTVKRVSLWISTARAPSEYFASD